MEDWSVHQFHKKAATKLKDPSLSDLIQYVTRLKNAGYPVILSLAHLAKITGSKYSFLHSVVSRRRGRVEL